MDINGQEFISYIGFIIFELMIFVGIFQLGIDYEYIIMSSCGANIIGVIDGIEIRDLLLEIIISNVVQLDCQGNDVGGFDVIVIDDCGVFYDISVGVMIFFNVFVGVMVIFIDLEGMLIGMIY